MSQRYKTPPLMEIDQKDVDLGKKKPNADFVKQMVTMFDANLEWLQTYQLCTCLVYKVSLDGKAYILKIGKTNSYSYKHIVDEKKF
jgi:hypothetical protein